MVSPRISPQMSILNILVSQLLVGGKKLIVIESHSDKNQTFTRLMAGGSISIVSTSGYYQFTGESEPEPVELIGDVSTQHIYHISESGRCVMT